MQDEERNTEQSPTTEQLARSGNGEPPPMFPGEATADTRQGGLDDMRQGDREDMRQETDALDAEETAYEESRPEPEGTASVPEEDEEAGALLTEQEAEAYQASWSEIQGRFVDDPQGAVRDADSLVAEVMQTLAGTFSAHKKELESQWQQGGQVATEDLRLALQRYRSFFGRLLRT
ncbi:hypothetical protein OG625_03475 [Streptomyces sp. NBC_01351]|uniref:hypothetical protein n=1 Tax=Streptomyces sp. NBC_01351 TaxID=2903833 RepID=UPI002E2EBEE6|nr:hypothetical protein [Streptomyces sp. NBC_01351]